MSKKIVIIGGGIAGLSSAYFLNESGHDVTVIDKAGINEGASFVNAGYITPSHIIPLASPGVIAKGLKWMFNSASPFYIKPRLDMDFLKWAWYFHRSSTKAKVEKAIPVIKDINVLSREHFEGMKSSGKLGDFHLENKGLFMLYQTRKEGDHELAVAEKARYLGLEVNDLDHASLQNLEPDVKIDALGAVHYMCDRHTTPTEFMPKLIHYLESVGVKIKRHETVQDIHVKNGSVQSVSTDTHMYTPDEVVLAAGSWSGRLAKKLGVNIPLQAGKGYRINVPRTTGITVPAVLMEAKAACTPMNGFTRFAGTMEFSGINTIIRKERVEAIAKAAQRYYPEVEVTEEEKAEAKSGLRPVSPDGLPYIGKSSVCDNLTFATGHAMMGWSLGPATGKLVTEIINGTSTSMDITPFSPDRKFG
ncbi:MAG: FAD-dependent oxidoreductase [Eudoraea sp.]|nr:FAD-dependent oxidoreductase [Eudoraea sp.]